MATVDTTYGTYLTSLFDPQVVGDMVESKLVDKIRFAPLCRIDNTLVGRPGSTISLPAYAYIGDAATVDEGEDVPIAQLTASSTDVPVHKIGNGVQLTDEAVLSGFGDPIGEAVNQLAISIASQLDNEVLEILDAITGAMAHVTATAAVMDADDISNALVKFGEDLDGDKVLLVNPADYNNLRKAADWCPPSEMAADMVVKGVVGMIHGCQVIISNKLTTPNTAYIVKPGALALYMKRDTVVETDRDIVNKSTVITADKHFAAYLYDASKAIKISKAS